MIIAMFDEIRSVHFVGIGDSGSASAGPDRMQS